MGSPEQSSRSPDAIHFGTLKGSRAPRRDPLRDPQETAALRNFRNPAHPFITSVRASGSMRAINKT